MQRTSIVPKTVTTINKYEFGDNSIIETGKMYVRKSDRKLCVITEIQIVDYSYHTAYNISYIRMDTGNDCCLPFDAFTKHWRPVMDVDIQRLGE